MSSFNLTKTPPPKPTPVAAPVLPIADVGAALARDNAKPVEGVAHA